MLDFYGDVVTYFREFAMELFHNLDGMPDTVKKIRVAERNMLRAARHLTADVLHHHIATHNAETAFVRRTPRTVPAKMFTSPACFGETYHSKSSTRQNQMRIFFHRRQVRP